MNAHFIIADKGDDLHTIVWITILYPLFKF